MTDTMIASAVTVPEPEQSVTNDLKRRLSEDSEQGREQGSKRQRGSPGKKSPSSAQDSAVGAPLEQDGNGAATSPTDTREARRKSSVADEKQRSRRLFGALLGSQDNTGDRMSKRRQEIESRRKAELQRQDDERLEDKQRRLEKLAEHRENEQAKVDEQNMHIRHANLLSTANFLQTSTEPRLYYRPWDLRPDEEDRIDDQIKDAKARIDQELVEFDERHGRKPKSKDLDTDTPMVDGQSLPTDTDTTSKQEAESEPTVEPRLSGAGAEQAPAKSEQEEDLKPAEVPDSEVTDPNTNDSPPTTSTENDVKLTVVASEEAEEEADHVVENGEDVVIY